jgi:hypothetical protein
MTNTRNTPIEASSSRILRVEVSVADRIRERRSGAGGDGELDLEVPRMRRCR